MQNFLIVALTGLNALLICLSQIALWQRKEYRIDRMKAYLLSSEGSLLNQKFLIVAAVFLVIAWMFTSELFAIISMLSMLLGHSLRIYKRGVLRPDFTLRASLVFLCTVFLSIVWLSINSSIAIHFAIYIFFLPVVVALAVGIVSLPAGLKKQRTISRAQAFRNGLKNIAVVGITGSVGKTSTKVYLTHLLGGESETIVATYEHRNSPYSVAEDMLARLSEKTRVYVAELGAYIPGEIAELARLTKPTIGIVTAITNQHVALFGSLAALAKTKWELIEALPENGIAILNKDDKTIQTQAKDLKKTIIWFSARTTADVCVISRTLHQDRTECTVSIKGEEHHVVMPTISMGQLTPILAAISGAVALEVDSKTIVQRLATLPSLSRTMELRNGISGSTVVDDSYSASEASVTNAIAYLSASAATDNRLVLVPIIELGNEGDAVHEKIGALLASLQARVFIYGDAYKDSIVRGLGSNPKAQVVWFSDAKECAEKVQLGVSSETIILLEGRVPDIMRYSIIS